MVGLIEQISGYTSAVRTDLPANTYDWIESLDNDSVHGGPFKYRSILPDVLAWVMSEATGRTFADLFSEHIWSHVASRDADIIVDSAGFPVVEGGICTTLEDLCRFGLMCLTMVSSTASRSCRPSGFRRPATRDQELIDAFVLPPQAGRAGPNACYRDFWWVYDSVAGIYCGLGINGRC
jgi:CubicO group peptidase (beta-lactamase class C family)